MSSESSTPHAFNKTEYGNIPLLTYLNYEAWKDTMFHVLRALDADNIITGEEEEPIPIDLDYKDYKKRASKAASIISLSCSPEIRPYLKGLQTPREMWETLQARLDSAVTLIGRTGILRKFRAARPQKDEKINGYFARLCEHRHQLAGTTEAISDEELRTHIYTTVPEQFKMTIRILMRQIPTPSVEEVMDAIREDADTDALTTEIGDTGTGSALYASGRGRGRGRGQFRGRGGRGGRGSRGRGYGQGRGGRYQPYTPRCTHCYMDNHTTKECGKAPRPTGNSTGNSANPTDKCCYHCGENGHFRINCPIWVRAKEAQAKETQNRKKPTTGNDNAHASIAVARSNDKPYSFE